MAWLGTVLWQMIAVTGKRLVQYEPEERQAYLDEQFDATAMSAAVTFLLGTGDLARDFHLSLGEAGALVLVPLVLLGVHGARNVLEERARLWVHALRVLAFLAFVWAGVALWRDGSALSRSDLHHTAAPPPRRQRRIPPRAA